MQKVSLFFLFLVAFASCSIEKENPQLDSLVGVWENTENLDDGDLSQSLRYFFNSDRTFNSSRVIIDNSTSAIIGYSYNSSGTYSVKGNQLMLNKTAIYILNDSEVGYADLAELEFSGETDQLDVMFSISGEQEILTFEYAPCGANENCRGSQSFKRLY